MSSGSVDTQRGPVQATSRVVAPYLYELIWNIATHGPLTAGELADDHNRPISNNWNVWTSQACAARLRGLTCLGLLERDQDGFYLLTEYGRDWITTGAGR